MTVMAGVPKVAYLDEDGDFWVEVEGGWTTIQDPVVKKTLEIAPGTFNMVVKPLSEAQASNDECHECDKGEWP